MYPLKNATAITIPIFAHDVNGDAVTGKIDANWTKRISKNGGAFAAMTVVITEMENGWYGLPVDAGHSDTNGVLSLTFTAAGVKQVNAQLRVHARLPDDLATSAALATVQSDTDNIQTRLPAALVGGRIDASVGAMAADVVTAAAVANGAIDAATFAAGAIDAVAIANGAIDAATFAVGAIDAAAIAADAIGASELAADAANEIADAILDRNMATGTDSGSPTVRTVRQALRFLRNKWSIAAGTLTVTKENDTTASWTSTLATDAAANPVTASDPA